MGNNFGCFVNIYLAWRTYDVAYAKSVRKNS